MSDNWVVQNLENALEVWNGKLTEIWQLITLPPQEFRDGAIWDMELMLVLLEIVQGIVSSIMRAGDFGSPQSTVLPSEIVTAIEDCGFFKSIPL